MWDSTAISIENHSVRFTQVDITVISKVCHSVRYTQVGYHCDLSRMSKYEMYTSWISL